MSGHVSISFVMEPQHGRHANDMCVIRTTRSSTRWLTRGETEKGPGWWGATSQRNDLERTTGRQLAERVGFEPTDHIAAINALAGRPIRPLWHLSWEPRSVAR
jgi:hypothetical protein